MRRDTIVGLFAIALGGLYCAQTFQTPKATIGNPWAPLIFPAFLGSAMVLLGVAIWVTDRKKAALSAAQKSSAKDPGYWKLVVGTVLLCVAYGFAFEHLGYIVSTLPFLFGLMTLINEPKRWKNNVLVTFVFTFTLWLVFVKGFQINLPTLAQGGLF